jgi:hypothetical protein
MLIQWRVDDFIEALINVKEVFESCYLENLFT